MGGVGMVVLCRRGLAALASAAVAVALLPAVAQGQQGEGPLVRGCPVSPPAAAFADRGDILDAHVRNVDCVVFFDIVAGLADESFRPGRSVRRDQMASFIVRTLEAAGMQIRPAEQGRDFFDVAADNPHRDNIRRLEATGIVRGGPLGRPADEYGPALPVRRDQMASMLDSAATMAYLGFPNESNRALGAANASRLQGPFWDVHPDSVHATRIEQAARSGLVHGFDDGTFRPGAHTRRDHMATFMTRLLHLLSVPARVSITDVSAETATVGDAVTVNVTVYTQFDVPIGPSVCFTPADNGASVQHSSFQHWCTVTFQTDGGETEAVEPDQHGQAQFTFTAHAPGTVTVTAATPEPRAFLYAGGVEHDSAHVTFVPAP